MVWEDLRSQIVLLEALFRVELATSPPRLYPTRFFSPAGVRLIVNHELEDVGAEYPMELINKNVRNGRREWIRHNNAVLREMLPRLLANLTQRAGDRAAELSAQSIADIDVQLLAELERLELLRRRGGPVTNIEIELLKSEIDSLKESVSRPVVTPRLPPARPPRPRGKRHLTKADRRLPSAGTASILKTTIPNQDSMLGAIRNSLGEKLDSVWHPATAPVDDRHVVVIGHGVTANLDRPFIKALADGLAAAGLHALRFSFSGNGSSERTIRGFVHHQGNRRPRRRH